jgi:phage baseplate assembly protein gpV
MAISTLTTVAREQSTYVVTCSFTDETGEAATPTALTWTLTDLAGTVINGRQDVAVAAEDLASSLDIVLSGDDLAVDGAVQVQRVLTIEGTYTSDAGGALPLKDAVKINIDPLVGVL